MAFWAMQGLLLLAVVYGTFIHIFAVQYAYRAKRAFKQLQLEMRSSGDGSPTAAFTMVVPMARGMALTLTGGSTIALTHTHHPT
jgi:hypothetical protein